MTIRGHKSFIQTALAAGSCLHTRAAAIATSLRRSPGEMPEQRVEQELPARMGTWPPSPTGPPTGLCLSSPLAPPGSEVARLPGEAGSGVTAPAGGSRAGRGGSPTTGGCGGPRTSWGSTSGGREDGTIGR